jgi:hypothetical protein
MLLGSGRFIAQTRSYRTECLIIVDFYTGQLAVGSSYSKTANLELLTIPIDKCRITRPCTRKYVHYCSSDISLSTSHGPVLDTAGGNDTLMLPHNKFKEISQPRLTSACPTYLRLNVSDCVVVEGSYAFPPCESLLRTRATWEIGVFLTSI